MMAKYVLLTRAGSQYFFPEVSIHRIYLIVFRLCDLKLFQDWVSLLRKCVSEVPMSRGQKGFHINISGACV